MLSILCCLMLPWYCVEINEKFDKKALVGHWKAEKHQVLGLDCLFDGETPTEKPIGFYSYLRYEIQEDRIWIHYEQVHSVAFNLTIHSDKGRKSFVLKEDGVIFAKGIFVCDGDDLIICYQVDPHAEIPHSFISSEKRGTSLLFLRRVRAK